jgi:hypothetical protein
MFILLYVPDTAVKMFTTKEWNEFPRLVIHITVYENILSLSKENRI